MRWRLERAWRIVALAGTLSLAAAACTPWVELSDSGAVVRVAAAHEVGTCERLGRTTAKGVDKLLGANRLDHVVERELQDMARNEAAGIGGDTIVADTPITDGRQSFVVYRCQP